MATVMDKQALALFQLCDSNFPTGAFSHSYGLETYIQEDRVRDQDTFAEWLDTYIHEQLVYSDGLASRLVFNALQSGDMDTIWKLDRMLFVQNLPRETREGTQKMGDRMLNLVQSLYESSVFSIYRERIRVKLSLDIRPSCLRWSGTISAFPERPPFYIIYIQSSPAWSKTRCAQFR
ncbi:urease accessory protein UreF [Paenibacillus alvei DSM 29]|nr:urease accessory protein UreF [Paenibacillus alvei DSM 29]